MYIHIYLRQRMKLQSLPCYCATVRQVARAVTVLYEEVLADSDLHATQYTALQVLDSVPNLTTTELADAIGIDQTTATRTLPPAGWRQVEPVKGSPQIEEVADARFRFGLFEQNTCIYMYSPFNMTPGDHHHVTAHREVSQSAIGTHFGGTSHSSRRRRGSGFRGRCSAAGEGIARWENRNPVGTIRAAR